MTRDSSPLSAHQLGEQSPVVESEAPAVVDLDSFFGPIRVEWNQESATTPLGQLPFFIDFLKASGLFDAFVADCPLKPLETAGKALAKTAPGATLARGGPRRLRLPGGVLTMEACLVDRI